jgi:pantothenate kinase
MRLSDRVRAILDATIRVYQSDPVYRHRPDIVDQLRRISGRLDEPMRIALAGTLKSGKSTLVT